MKRALLIAAFSAITLMQITYGKEVREYDQADTNMPAENHPEKSPDPIGDVLSDDFMRDVSDGSTAATNGEPAQEENGDTMDQTLRLNTKSGMR